MNIGRRGFLAGIIAACAAPAIVRAGLIMPIKPALVVATEMPSETVHVILQSLEGQIGYETIRVNGEYLNIARGVSVPIPRFYFEALRNSNLAMTWNDGIEIGFQSKDHVMKQGIDQLTFPRAVATIKAGDLWFRYS